MRRIFAAMAVVPFLASAAMAEQAKEGPNNSPLVSNSMGKTRCKILVPGFDGDKVIKVGLTRGFVALAQTMFNDKAAGPKLVVDGKCAAKNPNRSSETALAFSHDWAAGPWSGNQVFKYVISPDRNHLIIAMP